MTDRARSTRAGRPALTFDDLPLFATDRDIAEAVVGPDDADKRAWCASVASLEAHGFPRQTSLYGKRYVPAVRDFYDRQYGPAGRAPTDSSGQQEPSRWTSPRSRRRA
ncbi:hypothetical protein SAMN02799636_01113 [Methylobacterium sp. 275MFSha3.1]|uniref:hypothetical protein n=1 Tax=Methylobacterium sp. 275MFSha3.1 TaxID=1502746 RepID=UPI0008A74353|nr:hypothetical protein [Methylobacterium sp. 275MFSha3.1]SEH31659.1 hypothetical protein SAMN02799636_01113 [Methylobacterium sp. 275MFSha3.1]